MLYSIGIKNKNTTTEVWINFIQIYKKKKENKSQNYFQWVDLVGIPLISENIHNSHTLSKWNEDIE